ncbi:hypothetical protein M6B38_120850 [Iris pallida]|uniref:Uncharacterized protein n=1 Tax=Iris pallida TaxID=29817 RepID=A0AAX6DZJ9_IRIPA|nr:hypothetical protein M6B38_110610 [Iris pallida]KAJ6837441.1 hypothetical protein M6B38_120850 [Iris pallida]
MLGVRPIVYKECESRTKSRSVHIRLLESVCLLLGPRLTLHRFLWTLD